MGEGIFQTRLEMIKMKANIPIRNLENKKIKIILKLRRISSCDLKI